MENRGKYKISFSSVMPLNIMEEMTWPLFTEMFLGGEEGMLS